MARLLNDTNFKQEAEQATKPVVIDIFADWCPPCQMMAPIFDELENEFGNDYIFAKLNVDEARELSITLGISSIPTFVFMKDGAIVARAVGYKSKEEMKELLKKYLG